MSFSIHMRSGSDFSLGGLECDNGVPVCPRSSVLSLEFCADHLISYSPYHVFPEFQFVHSDTVVFESPSSKISNSIVCFQVFVSTV